MKFTEYIWELYRNSEKGKNELQLFKKENIENLSLKFDFELKAEYVDENSTVSDFYPYNELFEELENDILNDFKEAKLLFQEIVINPIIEEEKLKYNWFFDFIGAYSTALYHRFPDYFLPYYFQSDTYSDFLLLCEKFWSCLTTKSNQKQSRK